MKEQKHTPGPWEFHQYDSPDAIQQFSIQTKDGKHICNAYPLSLNARANAELIARAPELLQEVEKLREERANHYGSEYRMADWYALKAQLKIEIQANETVRREHKNEQLKVDSLTQEVERWQQRIDELKKSSSYAEINRVNAENSKLREERKDVYSLLKDYEQWEADLISDDRLWWPNREKDVLRGEIYDRMLKLQEKRNILLSKFPEVNDQPSPQE